jgi:thiamine biosynthesis lipoprotein
MAEGRRESAARLGIRRRWLAAAGILLVALVGAAALPNWFQRTARFTGSTFAMDTLVTVTVYGPRAAERGRLALAEFERLDKLLSAFRTESEVGQVNAAAGREPVRVSRETVDLVALALRYAALSGGAFDPTVGPLVRLWAIGNGRSAPPAAGEVEKARELVDYRRVMLDQPGRRLYLPRRGMALDLGAVAKGYAAERAAGLLRQAGVKSALIDAGGNIAALGTRPDGRPWRVGLQHPRRPGEIFGVLAVADRAVVTSGDYERYFESGGRRYHHLLDPATGYPAGGVRSATVVAPSSTLADILSTAVFVLGPERGPALARAQGAATVVVDAAGQVKVDPALAAAWTGAAAAPGGKGGRP